MTPTTSLVRLQTTPAQCTASCAALAITFFKAASRQRVCFIDERAAAVIFSPADFDTIGKPTGTENARFADFSSKAVRAAGVKLTEFLKLMPAEDVEAARSQLDAFAVASQ